MINETEALGRLPDEPRRESVYGLFYHGHEHYMSLVFFKRFRLIHGSDTTAFY